MSGEQVDARHDRAMTPLVVSVEDDDVTETILLLILCDRIDEIITVHTLDGFEHTFTVTACCDDGLGRAVHGVTYREESGAPAGVVDIPLSVIVGVHVW